MLDLILFVLAATFGGEGEPATQTVQAAPAAETSDQGASAEQDTGDGQGNWNSSGSDSGSWITKRSDDAEGQSEGGSLLAGINSDQLEAAAPKAFVAEPQTPTGKFTTATEVKPILVATKGNWVAVREFNGQDLLYVTHIWAWRCGLHQMRYSVNGGPMQEWPLPPCHEGTNAPNAITESDGLPYDTFALGSLQTMRVELLMDDLSVEAAEYARSDVLMP